MRKCNRMRWTMFIYLFILGLANISITPNYLDVEFFVHVCGRDEQNQFQRITINIQLLIYGHFVFRRENDYANVYL